MTRTMWVRRCAWMLLSAPALMLTGCPSNPSASTVKTPTQATAPATQPASAAASASAGANTQAIDNSANAVKAQALIARAKASYQSGVSNYQANHLDAARMDFDAAVDLMLTSGMDLKSDPLLSDEFERLLNAVNSLEMAALKQGNGFSPKIEEAPIDAVGELTFAPNPKLTAQLRSELQIKSDLPLVINDEVAGYIGAFANSNAYRAHMAHSLARSGRYKAIIQKALADQGLPQDLFYLAVAESGFQPQALNAKSGAGGMWQFMPTGAYGLARNGYVDERFDPLKSSVAYAKYMKELYRQLGDWYLAMAGYDWGPGYVQRAVMKTGYADFWELYRRNMLPKETKEYVPKILAAVIMAKNPAKYGLDKVVPDAPMVWDTVTVDYALDLRLAADVTDASLQEIVALNPSLLRMTTPAEQAFDLHLPVGTKELFTARLKAIPADKRASWRFHAVRGGESLETIATQFHAHLSEIAEANGLKPSETVEEGDELVIPLTLTTAVTRPQRYMARRGDTLVMVADRFNISVEDLRRWNHLRANTLRAGQSLSVVEPVALGPSIRTRRAALRAGRSAGHGTAVMRGGKRGAASSRKGASKRSSKSSRASTGTSSARAPKTKHKAKR